jgi:hypothetical protein
MPSLRLDTTSAITSKVVPQSAAARSMTDSKIYVQRSFDLTELDVLQNGGERETKRTVDERKQSETPTAWTERETEASRGSSQEVLVPERECEPGNAK